MDKPVSYWETRDGKRKIVKLLYQSNVDFRNKIDEHILKCEECSSMKARIVQTENVRRQIKLDKAHENLIKPCNVRSYYEVDK